MTGSCLIVAGEKSGEDHALSFFPSLVKNYPNYNFFGVGGDELKDSGLELLYHLKDFSSMGFSEVLSKIPFYFKALNNIVREVDQRNCRLAILVDFQEFNYNLAKRLKKKGVTVLYYVAPQAWIWREYRAKTLATSIHTLYTILPFEKKWFRDRGVKNVTSVVHPILKRYEKEINIDRPRLHEKECSKEINVLLLPGSRNHEVKNLLPTFAETLNELKEKYKIHLSIVKSTSVSKTSYDTISDKSFDKIYFSEDLSVALNQADLVLAASGTVTLISGLFQVPTIVCYKVSFVNEMIYKLIVRYYGPISLTNIILGEKVFPELLQTNVTVSNLKTEIETLVSDKKYYSKVIEKLGHLRSLLKGDMESAVESIGKVMETFEQDQ